MKAQPISWSAIFTGASIGFGLNFLLNFISLAIGLSIFSEKNADSIEFSLAAFAFFIIAAVIAMSITGWVAGRLTIHSPKRKSWGIAYGFLAWTICFIMTIILITNMLQFTYFHSSFTSKNLVAIRITGDMPMTTETKSINADLSKKNITMNAQVTILLFMVGAISSSLGGYLGYRPNVKREKT
ncbi:MAG: hypothetical protein JO149_04995 [Gammaproteobacteria bacterium]|nr:hypothetical protein [Gammaproteobacteria bacterium]